MGRTEIVHDSRTGYYSRNVGGLHSHAAKSSVAMLYIFQSKKGGDPRLRSGATKLVSNFYTWINTWILDAVVSYSVILISDTDASHHLDEIGGVWKHRGHLRK